MILKKKKKKNGIGRVVENKIIFLNIIKLNILTLHNNFIQYTYNKRNYSVIYTTNIIVVLN